MKKETKINILILMNLIFVALTLLALITGRILVTLVGIICVINGLLALKRVKEE
ncbi:TPA: ubiquinone biosynthesis protein UbiA [Methanocaldococcus jannaschii]|uniref:Ubiquinone biosynthesis protein UbiA n=1 Tax=Methanocaldococcus jannaschii TaxID=2190 RepID=A0A832W6K9_9EURY|nr:hypothetical protein [Methanocaldococcus jannaschii]HII59853.1 ubiquinone biosynthesis protein UbiA [Methanocaldococcus jannaschii]